jgi:hypothetical protein
VCHPTDRAYSQSRFLDVLERAAALANPGDKLSVGVPPLRPTP